MSAAAVDPRSSRAASGAAPARRALHHALVVLGAAVLTLAFFLVLPLIQAISRPPQADTLVRAADTANLPPPPPPPPEEEPEQEEEEEPPPELEEDTQPLDLSQLELALDPGFSDAWMGGDFEVNLNTIVSRGKAAADLGDMAGLDQAPRAIYQPGPALSAQTRRKAPGQVVVLFIVDEEGRVENPIVQSSTDPVFERPALAAVKQWRFEPGRSGGKAVRRPVRQTIIFPEG